MSSDLQLRMVVTVDPPDRGVPPQVPQLPLYYELWNFEGDVSVLPRKWCRLINTCFPERDIPFDEQQFVEKFSSQPQFDPSGFFMITQRSKVVASAFAWQDGPEKEEHDREAARLHWLAVHPDHRGKGLGKMLVALVIDHLRQRGHQRVTLRTQGHRVPAIRLYQNCGFVIDPNFGAGSLCTRPLRIVEIPPGSLVGFKAFPSSGTAQLLEHCASHDGVYTSKNPLWSGIYVQLTLAQAINYLPNQFERAHDHPLYLQDRVASIVELRVPSGNEPLQIAVSDDPRIADTRISSTDKAWLIFDQMRRTWPDDSLHVP